MDFEPAGGEAGNPAERHLARVSICARTTEPALSRRKVWGLSSAQQASHDCDMQRIEHGVTPWRAEEPLRYVIDHRISLELCFSFEYAKARSLRSDRAADSLLRGTPGARDGKHRQPSFSRKTLSEEPSQAGGV
ncbi:MAG: hypothetical protein N2561_01410 [Bacteroidetes bacterium]|nr:hypothetical protein [Rhodothermia bacterium]MCX7906181.1 hypothetical protein [Bacteroidota bacterium]MDW8285993.1 hypothetical protein [Bacteroidota bacterium]